MSQRTPRLVKWAVHATRKPKDHEAADTLYGRWRTEAAERGVDPDAVVRQVSGRIRDRDQGLSERTVAEAFERLASPDGLTATASTFARQDVIAALGGQLPVIPDQHRLGLRLLGVVQEAGELAAAEHDGLVDH